MQGHRAWILLLLAAVFTMHGLQCAADDSGTASATHAISHAGGVGGHEPVLHPDALGAALTSADHRAASPLTAAVAPAPASVPVGAGHDSDPHAAGHLWALCLAVLAAGLAALSLALAGRLLEVGLPRARPHHRSLRAWLSPLRPPDLHSLCLMRT